MLVETPDGRRLICHPRGKKSQTVVGDRVLWQATQDEGTIEKVQERRNLFYRQDEIRTKSFAANLDQILIVLALSLGRSGIYSIVSFMADLTSGNARELLAGFDLIMDGSDNFEARFLINDYSIGKMKDGVIIVNTARGPLLGGNLAVLASLAALGVGSGRSKTACTMSPSSTVLSASFCAWRMWTSETCRRWPSSRMGPSARRKTSSIS